jgi:peptidylprolyl isomerase
MLRSSAIASLVAGVVAVAVAGCGSDEDKSAAPPAATQTPAATASATATAAPKKPTVRVPKGKPPTKLIVKDLREGTGPAAKPGDTVSVQYVGVNYKGGKQFDASWDRGEPFSFPLGSGQVIKGWDLGVAGMKVGGRRLLIIPPDLGYGPQGSPPVIKPNETLVFVVDLLAVQ